MWIFISLFASLAQMARNLCARSISKEVSVAMNNWARFAFMLPLSGSALVAMSAIFGRPNVNGKYFLWCLAGAAGQLVSSIFLLLAYKRTTFAEVTVFSKLEAIFGACIGLVFFSEKPSDLAWLGILLSFIGVLCMNASREERMSSAQAVLRFNSGTAFAALTGLGWAIACFFVKEASVSLHNLNPSMPHSRLLGAVNTLFYVTLIQVIVLTTYVALREPSPLVTVKSHCKAMLRLGTFSFLASMSWFTAYNLTLVAHVRAVGNVESLFSIVASLLLREKSVVRQIPAIFLIAVGIVVLLLSAH